MKSRVGNSRFSRNLSGTHIRFRKSLTLGLVVLLALLFAVVPALRRVELARKVSAQKGTLPPPPPPLGILYQVDSTLDGDNVPLNGIGCNDGTNHCTLRAAIEASSTHVGNDTITFSIPASAPNCDAGTGRCIINLTKALPDVSDGVTITGPGADKLTVQTNCSGACWRIFNVTTTGTVTFSGLTIAAGSVVGSGGGIQNVNAGTVNATNSTLSGNKALISVGTAFGLGGGISNISTGTINVMNSALSNNSADGGSD